jgi:hypothetical protein
MMSDVNAIAVQANIRIIIKVIKSFSIAILRKNLSGNIYKKRPVVQTDNYIIKLPDELTAFNKYFLFYNSNKLTWSTSF